MKKANAQISGETLMYVLSIFIISLIIIMGYKYISSLKNTQQSSSLVIFKNNLKNDILKIKKDYGALSKKEYNLPEGVEEICFVDKRGNNPLFCRGCQKSTDYRDMIEIISNNASSNIFLLDESVKNTFRVENIRIGCCAFKCFKAGNRKLKLTIEGDGKYALIS